MYDSKGKKKQVYIKVVAVKMKKELHQTRVNLVLFATIVMTSQGTAHIRCIKGVVCGRTRDWRSQAGGVTVTGGRVGTYW